MLKILNEIFSSNYDTFSIKFSKLEKFLFAIQMKL